MAWRRLDIRMLLVHPVNEVVRFLPALIAFFLLGSSLAETWWHLAALAVPVALGVLRYVTTRFRVHDGRLELRRGLVRRSQLTARLDRVRTVELAASPIHRLLGLAKVDISTASAAGRGRLVLDALPRGQASGMRAELLHERHGRRENVRAAGGLDRELAPASVFDAGYDAGYDAGSAATGAAGPGPTEAVPAGARPAAGCQQQDEVLLQFDPRWMKYAPLTAGGLTVAVAIVGLTGRFVGVWIDSLVDFAGQRPLGGAPVWLLVAAAAVLALVAVSVLAVIGYVLSYWGFTVTRDRQGRSLQVRRGLATARETSIDAERIRGAEMHEGAGLRSVGAARLSAIVTGQTPRAAGSAPLAPPAPRVRCMDVGARVLGTDEPLAMMLTPHGPRASARRYLRAALVSLLLVAGWGALVLAEQWDWRVALAAFLAPAAALPMAWDRARRLGHALTSDYVIGRAHCLRGERIVVARDGIIGWNVKQTFFQRRARLATLTATTAGGAQGYVIHDVPEADATALANEATPGMLTPFLAAASPAPPHR
jgi:putative membrane protein